MGFSSQSGQVIVRSQAVADTPQADLDTAGVGVKLRSGSMAVNRDLLTTDPEIGGGRDTTDAYLGPAVFSGDYEMYPRFNSLPTFLRAGLGDATPGTLTAGVAEHTFEPLDSGTLPFLTIQEEIGGTSGAMERFLFHDAVVNTLHFEAEANGFLQATAGMIARKLAAGAATIDASGIFDNTSLVVGTNVAITYNGVTLPVKDFSWDFTNNFEDDDFRLGSLVVGDLTGKARELTGSFTIRHANSALWRQATFGTAAATAIGGLTTKQALVITCNTYEFIGATAITHRLVLTMPKVILNPFGLEPSGDDILENSVDWTAVRPDPATPLTTLTLRNGLADIA
jgi:tail tube protein